MVRSWLKMAGVDVLAVGLFGAALGLLRGGAHTAETPPQKATPAPVGTKPLIDTDFSRGTFAALGWMPSGAWDIFTHAPKTANNPGAVARFPARKADGSLTQFKRGWSYTAVYLLRDRTDEAGNQAFGFFKPDYAPRKAARYLHNLTTILADRESVGRPGRLDYALVEQLATVHDLLLQRSDGTFFLVVWGERLKGSDDIIVRLGATYPGSTGLRPDGRDGTRPDPSAGRGTAADGERPPADPRRRTEVTGPVRQVAAWIGRARVDPPGRGRCDFRAEHDDTNVRRCVRPENAEELGEGAFVNVAARQTPRRELTSVRQTAARTARFVDGPSRQGVLQAEVPSALRTDTLLVFPGSACEVDAPSGRWRLRRDRAVAAARARPSHGRVLRLLRACLVGRRARPPVED